MIDQFSSTKTRFSPADRKCPRAQPWCTPPRSVVARPLPIPSPGLWPADDDGDLAFETHGEPPLSTQVTMSPSRLRRKFARAGRNGSHGPRDSPNFLCCSVYSLFAALDSALSARRPIAASCRTAFSSGGRQALGTPEAGC